MAVFPDYQPEYGASCEITPRVRKAQFGDGYTQRVGDGLNNMPRKWSVTFRQVTADADIIEAFLESTKGAANFSWTPPRGAAGKWVVSDGWSRNVSDFGYENITVVFEEDFGT